MLQAKKRMKNGLSRTGLENEIADNDRGKATEEKHVNTQQHKTKAKKESKEVFMDTRESRRSAKVRVRLQVEV